MKPTKSFRILTPIIMSLFILSIFSGVVAAQATAGEQYEKANEIYQANKDKYDNARKNFEEAKDIFEKANKQLGKLKDEKSTDELKQKAKDYLLRAIDFAQSQLQVMKSRIGNSENKNIIPFDAIKIIDGHTAQLEQLKAKVEKANSTQELKDAHKELKKIVVDINLETRYYMGIVLNHRIDNFIIKADNVSIRLDSAIKKLKAQGNDTTKLEKEVADFNNAVKKAKESQTKTNDLYATHNGFATDGTVTNERNANKFLEQGNKLQKETIKDLRTAGNQVIQFVKDLRKLVVNKGKASKNDDLDVIGGVTTTLNTGGVTTTLTTTG
jgi:tetratricopeptide (TPR) repeat protein